MLTYQPNIDDVYGGNYDEPHSNTITINLILIRYRVDPPSETESFRWWVCLFIHPHKKASFLGEAALIKYH